MHVNIIHDSRRSEKYEPLMNELREQNIVDYTVWPAVILQNVVESISMSFKNIIVKAKEKGDQEVCIMEDDVFFPSKDGWKYFLENKPESYDIYLGGSYIHDNRNVYEPPLVRVKEWVGNHLIVVAERYYDVWLATNPAQHCDTVHSGFGEFYVCFPFVALQRAGWSANSMAVCNYNPHIPKEHIYGKI